MEISGIDRSLLTSKIKVAIPDSSMMNWGEVLETLSIEALLQTGNNDILRETDNQLRSYAYQKIHEQGLAIDQQIDQIADLAAAPFYHLQKAFELRSPKHLLIMLFLQVHLPVSFDTWGLFKPGDDKQAADLFKKVSTIVQQISFRAGTPNDAPFWEKQLLRKSKKAKDNKNIEAVYEFIRAIERSPRGFHFMPILRNLISFWEKMQPATLSEMLQQQEDPMALVFYLSSLPFSATSIILASNKTANPWLIFELIRKIDKNTQNNLIGDELIEATENALGLLYTLDQAFLLQLIKFFTRSILLNTALGSFLGRLPVDESLKILSSSFQFDRYHNNIKAKNELMNSYKRTAPRETLIAVLQMSYQMWHAFIQQCRSDKDFYANSLVITDQADFVVYYYMELWDDAQLIEAIGSVTSKVRYLGSEWFESSTREITTAHLYLSELFLMSTAAKEKNLQPECFGEIMKKLKEFRELRTDLFNHAEVDTIELILKNLSF